MFLRTLRLDSLLSFAPGSPEVELRGLNVVIGPNGSGKSNILEAVELLRATPSQLASTVRLGGHVRDWLWNGGTSGAATIDARLVRTKDAADLRYRIAFTAAGDRLEVIDEALEAAEGQGLGKAPGEFFYRFQNGNPVIRVASETGERTERNIQRTSLVPDESVLSQRKEPDLYPELAWVSQHFSRIQTFREWSFGRMAKVRFPQSTLLSGDTLLPDASNLALVLNEIEHSSFSSTFNEVVRRLLPRAVRVSTRTAGGQIQFYVHEDHLAAPVPAARLSDGTIRFLAICAVLLQPQPPPLICIEEPELGLHPDALSVVADLLVEASRRTQLIVTTHSDVLLSFLTLHPESVLVCEHVGGTQLYRLAADELGEWLDQYRLGEVWRMGVIGGNP